MRDRGTLLTDIQCAGQRNKPFHLYMEALRVFSIFWVIFNHTGKNGYLLFREYAPGTVSFWLYLFISVFCKAAVPVFLAISGALLLGKRDEPLRSLWRKRILKMALILFFYSLAYFLWTNRRKLGELRLATFFSSLYSSPLSLHLWYLYLALLMSLPFLRALANSMDNKYYWYLFGLALVFSDLRPLLEYLISGNTLSLVKNFIPSWLIGRVPLFVLAGYFLHTKIDMRNMTASRLIALWVIDIVAILFVAWAHYQHDFVAQAGENPSETFLNKFVLINCFAWFLTARYAFSRIRLPKRAKDLLIFLGRNAFIVYLLHVFFVNLRVFRMLPQRMRGVNPMLACAIEVLCIMIICYLLAFAYRFALRRVTAAFGQNRQAKRQEG